MTSMKGYGLRAVWPGPLCPGEELFKHPQLPQADELLWGYQAFLNKRQTSACVTVGDLPGGAHHEVGEARRGGPRTTFHGSLV
jgi:hypothetical protein